MESTLICSYVIGLTLDTPIDFAFSPRLTVKNLKLLELKKIVFIILRFVELTFRKLSVLAYIQL